MNTLLSSANIFETLLKNFLVCDLITAFARFQKYCLSLVRYSTSKSPSFMLCQNLIETLFISAGCYLCFSIVNLTQNVYNGKFFHASNEDILTN